MLWMCLDVADIHADIPYVVTISLIPLNYMYLETARYVPLDVSLTFPDSTSCTDEVVKVMCVRYIIQLCSGITRGTVSHGELYAQNFQS